ncbi:MAG: glycosyltransferase family 2 protein [Bacteroidota bacterium]
MDHWKIQVPPLVSVIIITWNGKQLLERFLPSVVSTDYPQLEVIVADNASDDDTVDWLAATHPTVRVVQHPENWRFARGNNAAVAHANADYLVFLNNDVEVSPGWLQPLVETLNLPGVVAVQPKLLQCERRQQFEYAGASGGFLDRAGVPFTRGRLLDTLEEDRGQYDDARDIFWATGAALAVQRRAFENAGGFDEWFEMHMEEIDLCWRLQRAGGRIRVEPASEVYHLGGASLPQGNPRKTYYNVRNSLVTLVKNLPPAEAARAVRARRVIDGLATLRAIASGRRDEARAIRNGWHDARARWPSVSGPPPGEAVVRPPYRGLLVTDYFLRGRRRFSDLPRALFDDP